MAGVTKEKNTVDDFKDTEAAAAYLNLQPGTLEAWRCRGGGPKFIRLSARAIRYRQSDLDEFVKERVKTSTSQN